MEVRKKVLILGAGSSASYGFPTGEDLKKILISTSLPDFLSNTGREDGNSGYLSLKSVKLFYSAVSRISNQSDGGYKFHFEKKATQGLQGLFT